MSKQKRQVEWSFNFEDMGRQVGQFIKNMTGDSEVELETAFLETPRNGATSARASIGFSVGRAILSALPADSDSLFTAQIAYVGEYEFEVTGDAERSISLRQKGRMPKNIAGLVNNAKGIEWHIALAQNIPWRLHLKGGLGETDINLSSLLVDDIKLDTGVGKAALTLPHQKRDFNVDIGGGVGKTDLTLPANSGGRLKISGGVGEVNVLVAPDSALRLKGTAGLGKISLPESLVGISGGEGFIGTDGVWETPDFASAERQTRIEYHGGVGSFRLKFFDVV